MVRRYKNSPKLELLSESGFGRLAEMKTETMEGVPKILSKEELAEELRISITGDHIAEVHTFGEYQIAKTISFGRGKKPDEVTYRGLINGRRTTRVWSSLDAAILGLVAEKHEGCNSQAGFYFARALGIYKKDE